MAQQNNQDYFVYVGTYTHGDSEGIYVYRLDGATGALEYSSKITGVEKSVVFWRYTRVDSTSLLSTKSVSLRVRIAVLLQHFTFIERLERLVTSTNKRRGVARRVT